MNKTVIRMRLIIRHAELAKGSPEDMEVAKQILHFLNKKEISLGLQDVAFFTEIELERAGLTPHYARNFSIVRFRL